MWLHVAVAFLAALAAVWIRFRTSRYCQLLSAIPSPSGLPVLGNTVQFVHNTDRILDYLKETKQKHGTFVLWLGPFALAVLSDPRDIKIVTNHTATLSKPKPYKVLELFLGNNLITARRNDWKRFHKIMSPPFQKVAIQTLLPVFNEKSRVLLNILKKHSDGQSFSVLKYMMMCTLDMVTETSLGMSMDILKNERIELVEGLKTAEETVYRAMIRPWYWSQTVMKTTALYKATVKGIQVVWDFADMVLKEKLLLCPNDDANGNTGLRQEFDKDVDMETKRMGFLDHALSCMQTDSNILTKTELRENTLSVIVAGTDTASIAISNVLMLLGLHQDVQKKVVDELEQIFGDDKHRDVTNKDSAQMMYLEQVINETMRLYPPLPIFCRAVEEEVDITGYTLPAGTIVLLSPSVTHRDAVHFPDPRKFDPDRFSPSNSVGRHPYSFVPFSAGRRMCLGKNYSYMQMKIILSTLLRHYQVLPCSSRDDIEKVKFKITLHNVVGYNIKVVARK